MSVRAQRDCPKQGELSIPQCSQHGENPMELGQDGAHDCTLRYLHLPKGMEQY